MTKPNSFLPVLFIVIIMSSCGGILANNPPYTITTPVCSFANNVYDFTFAGIVFNFLNKSTKPISSLTGSFRLYDGKTEANPFHGSNAFEITRIININVDENRVIVLSLDPFIHVVPEVPYIVDFFYISKIKYTDGTVWEDKFGVYAVQ